MRANEQDNKNYDAKLQKAHAMLQIQISEYKLYKIFR